MSITIGSQAPDTVWQVAWDNAALASPGATMSLAGCLGKVVMLYITDLTQM